jgi:cytoskeletal protein RodZ
MPQGRLPEIIGSALKSAREKRGMELADLATQCCISSRMVLELEEGGMTSFYSFQLKLSTAKRVATYLGLSPEEYLGQVNEVVQAPDPLPEVGNVPNKEYEKQSPMSTPSVINEGELDDLIIESAHSGTSLPHFSMRSVPVKRAGLILGLMVVLGALYGLENRYEISSQVIALFESVGSKKVEQPEIPKEEFAAQESKQDITEEKAVPQIDTKPEFGKAVAASQGQCPPVRDDQTPIYKSPNPSKPGDAVSVKTLIKQSICVTDGQGKQTLVDLESNTAYSFKGLSPFIVSAQDLDNVEMFYQGWRVRPPNAGIRQMKLVEVAIQ